MSNEQPGIDVEPISISEARKRVARGEEIPNEARIALRSYFNQYAAQKIGIHVKQREVTEWKDAAAACGTSLSSWIRLQVQKSLAPDNGASNRLREENDALRSELSALQGINGTLAVAKSSLETRIIGLEKQMMQALENILKFKEARK